MFRSVIRHLPANEKQRCVSYGRIIIGFWWKHLGILIIRISHRSLLLWHLGKPRWQRFILIFLKIWISVWIAGYLLRKLMEGVLPCGLPKPWRLVCYWLEQVNWMIKHCMNKPILWQKKWLIMVLSSYQRILPQYLIWKILMEMAIKKWFGILIILLPISCIIRRWIMI